MTDPIVVTYQDVTIHSSDLDLLEGTNWLNDSLLAYYFEYLTYDIFKDYKEDMLFVHPSTMFITTFMEDQQELIQVLKDLKIPSKKWVFLPINNNTDISNTGGSHWALLVFARSTNTFSFYDSYGGHNRKHAVRAASKLWPLLGTTSEPKFVDVHTPQQKNGYDCGLYVLSISEFVAKSFIGTNTESLNSQVTQASMPVLRKKMKDDIISHKLLKSGTSSLFSLSKKKKEKPIVQEEKKIEDISTTNS